MENNLFEYLIIIFFIFSILQSIFKKKKKNAGKPAPTSQRPEQRRTAQTQRNESAQDILEEIFGFKAPKPPAPQPKPQPVRQSEPPARTKATVLDPFEHNQTTWHPEEEYEDSIGVQTIRYENKREEKPSYQQEMAKLERMAERSKDSLAKLPDKIKIEDLGKTLDRTAQIVQKIKNSIHNPETLRDYIIVSEILNKPKALRR